MTAPRSWLLFQLVDGSFPSGAFAHSGGLEAALVLGALEEGGPLRFLEASLRQIGRAVLPFVRATASAPSTLAEVDDAFDATMPLLGPNRASRAQGRAFASAAARIWGSSLAAITEHARLGPAHHGPIFGAIFGQLGIVPEETMAVYLHSAARGVLSAAVRLGLLGPLEAQRLHAERATLLDEIFERARVVEVGTAAQTSPLIEIFAALHDRLDGRMFQS